MGFEKRLEATEYTPQDDDTLENIAERETANGNPITAADIAKFNWGTDDQVQINEFMRDELGCRHRDEQNNFVIASDDRPRSGLLIPRRFRREGFAVDREHTLRVRRRQPTPQFLECCSIPGATFAFDKSFMRPTVVGRLQRLEEEVDRHPDAKIMILGHTDAVGSDTYNKALSERRALSTYAFITNNADIWEDQLYNHPNEQWGLSVVQEILNDLGHDPGPIDGVMGPQTRAAIQSFNPAYNDNTSPFRRELFYAYMTSKHDVQISEDKFMEPRHMGCGEFNRLDPVTGRHEPNRRVTFFLFHQDRLPNLPCVAGDTRPCVRQFAPATRDNPPPPPPRHRDAFWCSFYDSIAKDCPYEGRGTGPTPVPEMQIVATQNQYTVVLESDGSIHGSHPILEFRISGGPPNHFIDVQVARDSPDALTGGPELPDAWDSSMDRPERIQKTVFSSWSNGDRTLQLDGSGAATYSMPEEWWRDLARLPLDDFTTKPIYFRVIAFPAEGSPLSAASTQDTDAASAPSVNVHNNLTSFEVRNLHYHPDASIAGRWRRFARIEFRVREPNTADMYKMVQWKRGGRTWEDGSYVWRVRDYDQQHASHYPDWQIDRVHTDPRYWDGNFRLDPADPENKIAYYEDDVSCGPLSGGRTEVTCAIDFISKMHLDADIPAAVTIDAAATTHLPDGRLDVYRGIIDENETPVLGTEEWSANMRVYRAPDGSVQVDH